MKLRLRAPDPGFHVVLVEPEIPQNTGNVARLCAATGSRLHLVGKLGFRTDEKAVRRAGLDYWHLVDVSQHPDLASCLRAIGGDAPMLFSANAQRSRTDSTRYMRGASSFFTQLTPARSCSISYSYECTASSPNSLVSNFGVVPSTGNPGFAGSGKRRCAFSVTNSRKITRRGLVSAAATGWMP